MKFPFIPANAMNILLLLMIYLHLLINFRGNAYVIFKPELMQSKMLVISNTKYGITDKKSLIENMDMRYIFKREVKSGDELNLMDFILKYMAGTSRNQAKQWLQYDSVMINDEIQNSFDTSLYVGDIVVVLMKKAHRNGKKIMSSKSFISILYEDGDIIVVDKPPGILTAITSNTISSSNNATKTMLYRVSTLLSKWDGRKDKALATHILDRDTSGVLIFSKSENVRKRLFADWNSIGKSFTCLTEGRPTPAQGIAESILTRDNEAGNTSTAPNCSAKSSDGMLKAVMYYRTVESTVTSTSRSSRPISTRHPPAPRRSVTGNEQPLQDPPGSLTAASNITRPVSALPVAGLSLVEVSMETQFKDQLRVQLAALGSPLCGDSEYGAQSDPLRRVALHCSELRLNHPVTRAALTLQSPVPISFRNLLRRKQGSSDGGDDSFGDIRKGAVVAGSVHSSWDAPAAGRGESRHDANRDEESYGGSQGSGEGVRVVSLSDYLSSAAERTKNSRVQSPKDGLKPKMSSRRNRNQDRAL